MVPDKVTGVVPLKNGLGFTLDQIPSKVEYKLLRKNGGPEFMPCSPLLTTDTGCITLDNLQYTHGHEYQMLMWAIGDNEEKGPESRIIFVVWNNSVCIISSDASPPEAVVADPRPPKVTETPSVAVIPPLPASTTSPLPLPAADPEPEKLVITEITLVEGSGFEWQTNRDLIREKEKFIVRYADPDRPESTIGDEKDVVEKGHNVVNDEKVKLEDWRSYRFGVRIYGQEVSEEVWKEFHKVEDTIYPGRTSPHTDLPQPSKTVPPKAEQPQQKPVASIPMIPQEESDKKVSELLGTINQQRQELQRREEEIRKLQRDPDKKATTRTIPTIPPQPQPAPVPSPSRSWFSEHGFKSLVAVLLTLLAVLLFIIAYRIADRHIPVNSAALIDHSDRKLQTKLLGEMLNRQNRESAENAELRRMASAATNGFVKFDKIEGTNIVVNANVINGGSGQIHNAAIGNSIKSGDIIQGSTENPERPVYIRVPGTNFVGDTYVIPTTVIPPGRPAYVDLAAGWYIDPHTDVACWHYCVTPDGRRIDCSTQTFRDMRQQNYPFVGLYMRPVEGYRGPITFSGTAYNMASPGSHMGGHGGRHR